MPEPISEVSRHDDLDYTNGDTNFYYRNLQEESTLDINLRNLQKLRLTESFGTFLDDSSDELKCSSELEANVTHFFHDLKEGNISRTVRVPTSEHVAEIVGRQGCKIKDLRARTNTYIKTPMRTQSPVFVVTGKEEAVLQVIGEIQTAAEHFTHIRACRLQQKSEGIPRPASREGDVLIQVPVPYRVVGLVVGLKGQTIKTIQQETETFIVTPNRDKAPIFEIRGQPANVERAKLMILKHIETRTRQCRVKDSLTTPSDWADDLQNKENDYTFFQNEALLQSLGVIDNCNDNFVNANLLAPRSSSFNNVFSSPTNNQSQGSFNWGGYIADLDQLTNNTRSVIGWSDATSQVSKLSHSTASSPSSGSMNSHRYVHIPHYKMSLGNLSSSFSSSTSSTTSISPTHDFSSECSAAASSVLNTRGLSANTSPFTDHFDQSPFAAHYSALSNKAPVSSSSKGNLGLENLLFPSRLSTSPSLHRETSSRPGNALTCMPVSKDKRDIQAGFTHAMQPSTLISYSAARDLSLFADPHSEFYPRGQSSPPSVVLGSSMDEVVPAAHGSPTPRVCHICGEADVVAALVPCGHNIFCMECAETIVNRPALGDRRCPACRGEASDVLRIRG